jgi:hypothetical protein
LLIRKCAAKVSSFFYSAKNFANFLLFLR